MPSKFTGGKLVKGSGCPPKNPTDNNTGNGKKSDKKKEK